MKIIQLTAENIKRLRAVQISPDGNLVVIGGRNAQGKTSVLDSITYALSGRKALPAEPIRRGSKKAQVVVELGDLVVTRHFTPNGSRLEITGTDGKKLSSPQAVLNRVVGELTFDPLQFIRFDSRKQRQVLCDLVNLDTSATDQERAAIYDARRDVNRDLKRAQGALANATHHDDAPDEEVTVSALAAELERRRSINAENESCRRQLVETRSKAVAGVDKVKSIKAQIEALTSQLNEAEKELSTLLADGKALRVKVDALQDENTDELLDQIKNAEGVNRRVRENREYERLNAESVALGKKADSLTARLEQIDAAKNHAIATAKYPVAGLAVDEDGVLFNGLPFDQASQAEQLRISVAIGLALNPTLRVLLIRDGSVLDADNLALVAKMAEEADSQLWIERVDEDEAVSVVIEDGLVKTEEEAA